MSQLASWFIQLSTQGKDKVDKDIDAVGGALGAAGGFATKAIGLISQFAVAGAAAVAGFALYGLSGTREFERMGETIKRVATQFASILLPVVELVQQVFSKVGGSLQGSFEKLQAAIGRIVDALGPALIDLFTELALIVSELVVPAVEKLADLVEFLTGTTGEANKGFRRLTPSSSAGIGRGEDTWKRFQESIGKGTRDEPQVVELKKHSLLLTTIAGAIKNLKPAFS